MLLCGVVGQRLGQSFPDPYWQRLTAACEFLRWITDADGNQPRIGDDDEGRVVASQLERGSYVSSVLNSAAAILGRSDLASPRRYPHLREAFFGVSTAGDTGPVGVQRFESGGYTVCRWHHAGSAWLLVFDHGPVGYLSIAAHGHADSLALWLHRDGQAILVDAGTYLYHSGRAWRDHFRGTLAHNTLSIQGESSSRRSGPFNWSQKAVAAVTDFRSDPERWCIEAEHDGYVGRYGVRHRRRVERSGPDGLTISDTLLGSSVTCQVEIGLLFHPRLDVTQESKGWVIRDGTQDLLTILGDGGLEASVQEGQLDPPRAWYSPGFSRRVAARRLEFRGALRSGESFRTHFVMLGNAAKIEE
jgi:hypothetical protein